MRGGLTAIQTDDAADRLLRGKAAAVFASIRAFRARDANREIRVVSRLAGVDSPLGLKRREIDPEINPEWNG